MWALNGRPLERVLRHAGVLGFISFSPTYVDFLGQVLGMNETERQAA